MASLVDSSMDGDTIMSSPTSGGSYPELFALDMDVAGEAAAQHYGQPFQRSMPNAPVLRPAPSAASWRHMHASHQRQMSSSSMSSASDAGSWMQQPMQQSYGGQYSIDPSLVAQMSQSQLNQHIQHAQHAQYSQHAQLQPPPLHRRTSTSSVSSQMSNPFEYGFDMPSDASISDLEGYDFGFGGSFGGNGSILHNGAGDNMLPAQLLNMPQQGQRSFSTGAVPTVGSTSVDPNMFRPKDRATSLGGAGLAIDPNVLMQGTADDLATAKPKRKAPTASHPVESARAPRPKNRSISNVSAASGAVTSEDEDGGVAGGRKSSHARKQKPNHIPRPRNAFILFRKHVVDAKLIPASVEIRHQNVSVIVAKMWAEASQEQKEEFNELARIEKEEHQKKYPGYRYQPVYRRTNVIRRRVRKDEAEEEKCRSVAELLIKGKSGEALEEGIKEKLAQEQSTKAKKARRANEANELSKGALRALRAQAKQAEARASPDWTDASAAPSRDVSLEPDQDSDVGVMGQSAHEKQLLQFSNMGISMGMQPSQMSYVMAPMGAISGGDLGTWAPMQQTYAYPEAETSYAQTAMPLAYAQPAQTEFYSFDQALPFSPSANTFSFSQIHNMPHPGQQQQHQQQQQVWSQDQPSYPVERHSSGMDSTLPVPPMTARWNASFQPGAEGVPYDQAQGYNPTLQDFGAALMQAEEMLGWA